ncbi:hypothetical protein AWY89_10635 [Pasteurella multocida subsp. multocida]|nr:hypothetical protein AWY89_10635 [Pasteurella multocida subsp. multocida]
MSEKNWICVAFSDNGVLLFAGVQCNLSALVLLTCVRQPQIFQLLTLGFFPVQSSYGVFRTDLVGTRFRTYVTVTNAYPQKDVGNCERTRSDRTMSNKVLFLLCEKGLPSVEATWIPWTDLHNAYLDLELEDKLVVQEGSDVMSTRTTRQQLRQQRAHDRHRTAAAS